MHTFASWFRTVLATGVLLAATGVPGQLPPGQTPVSANASTSLSVSSVNGHSVVTLNGREIFNGPTTGQVASRSSNVNGIEYCAVYDGSKLLWENTPGAGQQLQSQPGGTAGIDPQAFAQQHRQAFEQMVQSQQQFMQAHGGLAAGTNLTATGGSSRSHSGGTASAMSTGQSRSSGMGGTGGSSGGTRSGSGNFGATLPALPATASHSSEGGISLKTVNGSTVVVYQGREFPVGPTTGKLSAKTRSLGGADFAAAFEEERVIWENLPGAAQQLK
jgi:hypothetical protein